MGLNSTNPVLTNLNLTLPTTPISSAITEIVLGDGQGEFSLDPVPVLLSSTEDESVQVYLNINTQQYTTENTDITVSVQQLLTSYPVLKKVHIEIAWYVTSLSCGSTAVQPGVTTRVLNTSPYDWQVCTMDRQNAYLVTTVNGLPAFRGTPSDQSLLNLLLYLSTLNLNISICLTVIPDIPSNNFLLNPLSKNGATVGQPSYPPVQLLTCTPAKGFGGSAWGTSLADSQINEFFGSANANSYTCTFSPAGVLTAFFNGTAPLFNYSNFVVYYATLLSSFLNTFSGVTLTDFFIGKNLSGLTSCQGASYNYEAVNLLSGLATEVATLFSGSSVKISYVADWNEWHGSQNETYLTLTNPATKIFSMDPLWSNSAISYIGISANYPTSDWRNSGNNIDGLYYPSSTNQPYIVEGLLGQQFYDWYYGTTFSLYGNYPRPNQLNQKRANIVGPTAITTWIYQLKNYDAWLENNHYNFLSSSFSASATSWVPNSKKVYLYGLQCPSVNLGTNQPFAYMHQNSSLYEPPFFSNGTQDTSVGSGFFSIFDTYEQYVSSNIDSWCASYWDDRPYPWFPKLTTQWSDCNDYSLGYSLNNKYKNIDPTATFTQYVDYSLLLTDQFANNPFWTTLVNAMGLQWNNLFNGSVNELKSIRNVNAIEDELKAASVRQMGFVVPDYGLQYYQYDSLMRYLGTFYLTRGNSNQFSNFVSFFSEIPFKYVPLYSNGLIYNTLTSIPGTLITASPSGTWIPTPYYDIYYNSAEFPNLDEGLYRQLLIESAPIYLVLREFGGQTVFSAVNQYICACICQEDIECAALWPPQFPLSGQSLLTISIPSTITPSVPFNATGTTLGATDSISISLYQTNNLTLILAGRATAIATATGTSSGNAFSVSLTSTSSQVYAVVTDTTQVARNGVISFNEVAISAT